MKIAFVTDSTAYLTPEQIEEYGISIVPLSVILEGTVYQEGIDLTNDGFFDLMQKRGVFPTTSQPPVGAFVKAFESLLETHDIIMCMVLSGNLSGTVRAAETAANMVEGKIVVFDSRITSFGLAGPVMDAVKMARQGASPEDIVSMWDYVTSNMGALFVLDTLEYLHRGGRIGGASAIFGALLQIKPILTVVDGRIELFEKVRTHKRAMERMLSEFDASARDGQQIRVGVIHTQRAADASQLRDQLNSAYPNVKAEVAELGPVIATHAGPGLLALVYYPVYQA